MASDGEKNLIHAGLPWCNPEKITVKSDQYISQLVINRGLLNLLSNDYYLDLKAERINEYVNGTIGPHIGDSSIHITEADVYNIINNYFSKSGSSAFVNLLGIRCNTSFLIPIYKDVTQTKLIINTIINSIGKNLNGYTLLFLFCYPLSQANLSETQKANAKTSILQTEKTITPKSKNISLTLNLGSENITFDSFSGGTLLVAGNDEFYFDDVNNDPYQGLTGKQTRLIINDIRSKLSNQADYTDKLIRIQSSANNGKYSVISFRDCNCDSFIWNLNIQMTSAQSSTALTVAASTSNSTTITSTENINFYNLIAFYTFNGFQSTEVFVTQMNSEAFSDISSEQYLNIYVSDGSLKSQVSDNIDSCKLNNSSLNLDNYIQQSELLITSEVSKAFRKNILGAYVNNGQIIYDNSYTSGVNILFWMNCTSDESTIPIISDIKISDDVQNGIYVGLQQIRIVQNNTNYSYFTNIVSDKSKYDITTFGWTLWKLHLYCNPTEKTTTFNISYIKLTNKDTINSVVTNEKINKYPPINNSNIMRIFSSNILSKNTINTNIRNLLFFNTDLTAEQFKNIAQQGPSVQKYNWNYDQDQQATVNNPVYGCVYAYNTKLLNVINCNLKQI